MAREDTTARMGLPIRPFLYTLEQVADFLSMPEATLKRDFLYLYGIHVGPPPRSKMMTRAINPEAPVGERQWRIAEPEFVRWLRYCGFRVYDRNALRS